MKMNIKSIKKYRLILLSGLVITSLLFSGTACAQDEGLPEPGITPDSPLYFFDTWGKNLGLLFAFGPEAKAKKAIEYAEERLAEAKAMATKNKIKEVERATIGYDKFVALAAEKAEEVAQPQISDNISERLALATSKHLAVLDRVREAVPVQAREAIDRAREVSLNGQKNALRALTRRKTERAIEINMGTIEAKLRRAEAKATENIAEEVEEALDDAEELLEFEEEILKIARGLGKDITFIEQRVAKSTANRLEVLARVYEQVPEQAKPAIENAMANSVRKHERVTEALRKKDALGEITEEAPIPKVVREEVKERILKTRPEANEKASVLKRVREEVKEKEESNTSTGTPANKTGEKQEEQSLRKSNTSTGTSINKTGEKQEEQSLRKSNR